MDRRHFAIKERGKTWRRGAEGLSEGSTGRQEKAADTQ